VCATLKHPFIKDAKKDIVMSNSWYP